MSSEKIQDKPPVVVTPPTVLPPLAPNFSNLTPPWAEPKSTAIDAIIQEEKVGALPAMTDSVAIEQPDQTTKPVKIHPHEKDVRKDWLEFIHYVKDRKVWMAQDLQRADSVKQEVEGELQLTYIDAANCSLLRQKDNRQILTEFALDFFQKPLKVRFIIPAADDTAEPNGLESPQRKRAELANDPLVIMAAEIFNGEVGDIRVGSLSR